MEQAIYGTDPDVIVESEKQTITIGNRVSSAGWKTNCQI
jgi:hypothetical protein